MNDIDISENWIIEDTKLVLDYEGEDFEDVVDLVNDIAEVAEELDHHPNLYMHSYNMLRIEVYTHKTNSLTKDDYLLAAEIDKLLDSS